jgi:hypothetical protein
MNILTGLTGSVYYIASSTAFSGEAMTDSGGGLYTITDAAKQPWDPSVVPTLTGTSKPYVSSYGFGGVGYANGTVMLSAAGETFTAAGKYLTLAKGGDITGWSLKLSSTMGDVTCIGDTWKSEVPLLGSATMTIDRYRDDATNYTIASPNPYILVRLYEYGDAGSAHSQGWTVVCFSNSFSDTIAVGTVLKEQQGYSIVGQPVAFAI